MSAAVRPSWLVVLRREASVALSEKSFRIGFAFTLVIIIAGLAALFFFTQRPQSLTVAVIDESGASVAQVAGEHIESMDPEGNTSFTISRHDDKAAAHEAIQDGAADAALLPTTGAGAEGWTITAGTELDPTLGQALSSAIQLNSLTATSAQFDIPLGDLVAGMGTEVVLISEPPENIGVALVLKLVFGFMFVSALMTFGLAIAQSIVGEKETRIVEILAAATPIGQLLVGKIAANLLLGLAQVSIFVAVSLIGLRVIDVVPELGPVVLASGWFIAFFVLGFAAVACIWAALGAMAARADDLASSAVPMQVVLFTAFFVGFLAPAPILTIASFIPILSSIAMPVRMLEGTVLWWEPLVAAILVLAVGLLAVKVSVRIYRKTLLQTNARTGLRRALQG